MTAPKADEFGFYRVHAIDGSGLDFTVRTFDPEIHVLVDEPATDYRGNPLPASAPTPVRAAKTTTSAGKSGEKE